MLRKSMFVLLFAGVLIINHSCVLAAKDSRPNIIVMMVDDMGFSDPGCYGGEVETPNIDKLAANGLRFTQFHNTARCCPTRASLLTGKYPHQVGLVRNGRSLSKDSATIAEVLKTAGYDTAMVGKWHLSRNIILDGEKHQKWLDHHIEHEPFGPEGTYPVDRGFDRHYGVIWGVIDYFDPFSLVDGHKAVNDVPDDYYFTDAITDKAIEYVKDFETSDKPFFMYFAHCAPHWPLMALPEDIEKYKETYKGGWQKLRDDRYERQIKMGLFDPATAKKPALMDGGAKWDKLKPEDREFEARKMAVHAAMVDRIDQCLGRFVKVLKATGQYDNTLIFLYSDNGASPEIMYAPGYDRTAYTREGKKIPYARQTKLEDLGSEMSYNCIGQAWANAANTPFRYWKKESFEGGCNTPCIIHWPAGLKAKKGSITTQFAHVMDIMPTCLELANATYPVEFNGKKSTPVEGKSLMPIINGGTRKGHEVMCFEHENGRAIRKGKWKLSAFSGRPNQWELYDIKNDITETTNLASQYPEVVEELKAEWQKWSDRVGLTNWRD